MTALGRAFSAMLERGWFSNCTDARIGNWNAA